MTVKVRTVYAGILGLAADGHTTSAAHSGSVHHDRVQRNDGLYLERLGRLTDKLHHGNRTDSNDNVILLALFQLLLQHIGHKALCAVGTVISAEIQVIAARTEFVFQNDNILVAETNDGIHFQTQAVQVLCLGICDGTSYAAADHADRLCAFRQFCGNAQRSDQI